MESEVDAVSEALPDMQWLKGFLCDELRLISPSTRFLVLEDNQACMSFLGNEWARDKTKHLAVRYHRVKEALQDGLFTMRYVVSKLQGADMLTKNVYADALETQVPLVMGEQFTYTK
jgi:hypothetical protein